MAYGCKPHLGGERRHSDGRKPPGEPDRKCAGTLDEWMPLKPCTKLVGCFLADHHERGRVLQNDAKLKDVRVLGHAASHALRSPPREGVSLHHRVLLRREVVDDTGPERAALCLHVEAIAQPTVGLYTCDGIKRDLSALVTGDGAVGDFGDAHKSRWFRRHRGRHGCGVLHCSDSSRSCCCCGSGRSQWIARRVLLETVMTRRHLPLRFANARAWQRRKGCRRGLVIQSSLECGGYSCIVLRRLRLHAGRRTRAGRRSSCLRSLQL